MAEEAKTKSTDKHLDLAFGSVKVSMSVESENTELEKALFEVRQLKKRMFHFQKAFPNFEKNRAALKELLKAERNLLRRVEELKTSADETSKSIVMKQDEIANLSRSLEKLKDKQQPLTPSAGQSEWETVKEGKDAISILPEEIWETIFKNLAEGKDLWNCSNTCQLFKKILEDWKKPTWSFMQAFPLLFQYLPREAILKCRLVSKGWSLVVHEYFENHPSLRPHDKNKYNPRMLPFISPLRLKHLRFRMLYSFDFRVDDDPIFRMMMDRMMYGDRPMYPPHLPGRNPFIGRVVTLTVGTDKDDVRVDGNSEVKRRNGECMDKLYSFLETYGQYIWYLTFDSIQGELRDKDGIDKRMLQLLTVDLYSLVPNLRKLHLVPGKHNSNINKYQEEEEEDNEPEDINSDSLPDAPKLESLEVDHTALYSDTYYPIALALMERHCGSLRALHLPTYLWSEVYWMEWANLRELSFDDMSMKGEFEFLLEAELPRLMKLGVNLRGKERSFDWLLDVIHKFFGTTQLNTLRLYGGVGPGMFQRVRWEHCMSPTLKTLELEHCGEDGFYNFLHYFPLVENLHLFRKIEGASDNMVHSTKNLPDQHSVEHDKKLVEVDLNKWIKRGRNKVYYSNIWKLLPRLKLLTFPWRQEFTRTGYAQSMGQKENIEAHSLITN